MIKLNKTTNYINLISIAIIVYLAFIPLKPSEVKNNYIVDGSFFLGHATRHVNALTSHQHYVGALQHSRVKTYIIKELQKLDLEIKIQKTTIANDKNTVTEVENIFTKIKGSDPSRKALVLMAHYDSAAYASKGAGDDASGVAVILEGIRAYLSENIQPKNDIIILITDAEEIGLLGAKAFVKKHHWTKNIGLVLNFEARGSAGSSYMLMETNGGNHNLLKHFNSAGVNYANTNSLSYSIYKMLPNDTDLTVFRKDKNINGFNFAFIDDHFNYHTALDTFENLSLDSLAHQAHYLMPLLRKFSQIDLTTLDSDQDDVYFQIPFFKTISYPFSWTTVISLANLAFFILILITGIKNTSIRTKQALTGSLPLFKSMIMTVLISFTLLKFLYWLHPQYAEMLQGFTYNGHYYIVFFSILAICITLLFYRRITHSHNANEIMVIPIFLWILLSLIFSLLLPGAHFFVLISILATASLFINVITKKPQPNLTLLFMAPAILVFAPLFQQLPVALGIMMLPFSGILLVMVLSSIIVSLEIPKQYPIDKWVMVAVLLISFGFAEYHSGTSSKQPLPNSLYYFQDNELNNAYMFSADNSVDEWTKSQLNGEQPTPEELKNFHYNYFSKITTKTDNQQLPAAKIKILHDRKYVDKHVYQLKLTTQMKVNRIDLITNNDLEIFTITINKEPVIQLEKGKIFKTKSRLSRIFPASMHEFIIDIEINPEHQLDLGIIETSDGLLSSMYFGIPARPEKFIPKPFINSDSIIVKQRLQL